MYGTSFSVVLFLFAPLTVQRTRGLAVFTVGAVTMGLVQFGTQSLNLPTWYLERLGIVFEDFVNGRLRVISIFASPPRFAEFLVFLLLCTQQELLAKRVDLRRLATAGLLLLLLYNTYSRAGYILWITATATQFVLNRRMLRQERRVGIISLTLFSTSGIASLLAISHIRVDASIVDPTSLQARTLHWNSILEGFYGSGIGGLLLGTGRAAQFSRLSESYFAIDNVLIAVGLYGGLIGILAWCILYVAIFRSALRVGRLSNSPRMWPAIAFYSGLVVGGMFVDNHNTVGLVQAVLLGLVVRHSMDGLVSREQEALKVRSDGLASRPLPPATVARGGGHAATIGSSVVMCPRPGSRSDDPFDTLHPRPGQPEQQ
jgi:hypothetical protein